jgi:hypothetical protein
MLLTPPEALLMAQSGHVGALRPAGLDEQQCSGSALSRMKCERYDAKFRLRLAQRHVGPSLSIQTKCTCEDGLSQLAVVGW